MLVNEDEIQKYTYDVAQSWFIDIDNSAVIAVGDGKWCVLRTSCI